MSLYRGPSIIGESADNNVALVLSAISSATNAANAAAAASTSEVNAQSSEEAAVASALQLALYEGLLGTDSATAEASRLAAEAAAVVATDKAAQTGEDRTAARDSAANALVSENAAGDKAAEASGHANAASGQADLAANAAATTQTLRDSIIATQGSVGYLPPVAYAAGLSMTLPAQTVSYSGQAYAPLLSALPFATSGTFETAKFRLIQGVAGVDLAGAGGAELIKGIHAGVGAVARTLQDKFRDSISVKDFGAKGDGITDDTAAIQLTLNSAGNNAEILFPLGRYKVTSTLTMPAGNTWQKLKGSSFATNSSSPAANVLSCIVFSGLAENSHGIITNSYATIEDLGIYSPTMTLTTSRRGISVGSEVTLNNVMCLGWDTGIYIRNSFYSRFNNVTLRFNSLGIDASSCFALTAINTKINGANRSATKPNGNGVLIGTGCYDFYGGTAEVYWGADGYAFKIIGNSAALNLDGVYFEPYGDLTNIARAAIAISGNGAAVNIRNSTAYIYHQTYFVEVGNVSGFSLTSSGNNFRNSSDHIGTLYKLPASGFLVGCSVDLHGDNLYNCTSVKPVYLDPEIDGVAPGLPNCTVSPPRQYITQNALSNHVFAGRPTANLALSAAPSTPLCGTIYWANGTTWNPFKSGFIPYPVVYDGTIFRQVTPPNNFSSANNVNFTLLPNENVNCFTNTSAVTITLPAAPSEGDTHTVKMFGGVNAVTITGSPVPIDGAATYTLTGGTYQAITVTYSGFVGKWLVTGKV